MSEYFESPSPSLSKSSSTTSNISSNNGTILNIDDDDNDIIKSKVTSEYSKVVGMIHRTMRKGDSCPLGKRKVMRKTYVHSQNRKDKNCEETFHSLRHFDECQNLDCRVCMHLIGICLSHYK